MNSVQSSTIVAAGRGIDGKGVDVNQMGRLLILLGTLLLAGLLSDRAARADDDPGVKVAEIAALAEIAPTVCPDIETRTATLQEFLDDAGLAQADLTGRYAEPAHSAAASFLASASQDREAACAQIGEGLGDGGMGLLGRKPR